MKKMKLRKLVCLTLAVACVAASFAGCGKKEEETVKTSSDALLTGVDEFPVVKEKVEFDVFATKSSFVADFETNDFTKWYEDKTNVHINWTNPSGDAQQSFNLMIASGEYPDFILGMGLSREQVMALVQQDILVDIKPHIEKYGTNIKKMFADEPTAEQYVTIDDKIYGVPKVSANYGAKYRSSMWVYQPWLDKMGIAEPQTTEEFYQMLKAFKEKDPNGNGQADEIPLAARGIKNEYGIESYLMSAFIPDNGNSKYYVDEKTDKVKCLAVQPEYRDGLRYMRKLYQEGLLYQDTFIVDRTRLTAIGESETPILGASVGAPYYFCNSTGTTDRYYEFTVIPPLEGPKGVRAAVPTSPIGGTSFMVTKVCEHPDVAVKWVDWLMSPEGRHKSQDRGLTIIREAKEGEKGINGEQALWTVEQKSAEEQAKYSEAVQNISWYNCTINYTSLEESLRTYDPANKDEMTYKKYSRYSPYHTDVYKMISIAPEDIDEYTDYTIITEEIESYYAKFVTGELDIEKDWDAYVEGLNGLGLKQAVELMQRNYDAGKK